MLCIEPSKRAKILEIKESVWFNNAVSDVDTLKAYLAQRKLELDRHQERTREEEKLCSVNGASSRLQTRKVRSVHAGP